MLLNNITLEATERVMVNASDLDLCNNNFTFTVVALTAAEPGESRIVSSQAFNNLSEWIIMLDVSVPWQQGLKILRMCEFQPEIFSIQ